MSKELRVRSKIFVSAQLVGMETSVHTKIQRVMSQCVLCLEEHVMHSTFFNILAAIVLVLVIMVNFANTKIALQVDFKCM